LLLPLLLACRCTGEQAQVHCMVVLACSGAARLVLREVGVGLSTQASWGKAGVVSVWVLVSVWACRGQAWGCGCLAGLACRLAWAWEVAV